VRYVSIDVLRTVAIAIMVIVHFVENLSGLGHWVPGGFAAPLFSFLVGVSYRLWLVSQEERGKSDIDISKITIRRGLFLLGVGFLFNVFVWLPEDVFNWDVLTFIGSAMIFLNVVRKMPSPIPLLVCGLIFLLSPLLRNAAHYPTYWTSGYFDPEMTLPDVLLGFLVNGFFPIFPWLIFPVMGYVVASWYFPAAKRAESIEGQLLAAGISLIAITGVVTIASTFELIPFAGPKVWTMFPASPAYVAGALGIAITSLIVAHRWLDGKIAPGEEGIVVRIASTFSRHSFTIYLLHHFVHIWPLWIYGMASANNATLYWQNAMPATISWPLSLLFLVLCYFFLRWMDDAKMPGIESLMRWVCD